MDPTGASPPTWRSPCSSEPGPGRARDFAWWSGLTMADVERGLALAAPNLVREEIEGGTHCSAPGSRAAANAPRVHLLPSYDEFLVAHRDRTAALARDRLGTASLPTAVSWARS
ncbi:MAG TPA: crosslink repair DNA glycosylase YcaQ family protein [Candidatus Dormibacteraeota bacterium]|nr:crosslink repair DNA glycosylase YcaQ family protein [Candidatus Dormibacteraeota bacterium]